MGLAMVGAVTLRIEAMTLDCRDPAALAAFWSAVLGWEISEEDTDEVFLEPEDGDEPGLLLLRVPEAKSVKNRLHFDLRPDNQSLEVARVIGLGASRVEVGQADDPSCTWVVLADPEGNEFCILRHPAS